MKKILLIFIILITLSFKTIAAAEIIYAQDYNLLSLGKYDGLMTASEADGSTMEIVKRGENNNCLKITDASDVAFGAVINIVPQSEIFTLELDVLMDSSSLSGVLIYAFDDGVAFPPAMSAIFGLSGDLTHVQENNTVTGAVGIKKDVWARFTAIINPKTSVCDIYINGEISLEATSFRNMSAKNITSIALQGASTPKGAVFCVDNVVVMEGSHIPKKGEPGEDNPNLYSGTEGNYESLEEKNKNSLTLLIGGNNAKKGNEYIKIDENSDVMPFTENGRTLVPVRFICESFNAEVIWEEETKTVKINADDKNIEMILGKNEMNVNQNMVIMDLPANTYSGRTFIPLRALAEAIGKNVFWDERGLIIISSNEIVPDEILIEQLIYKLKD